MASFLPLPSARNLIQQEISSEFENLKTHDLEKYIRLKLGQRIFPTPIEKSCLFNNTRCNCKNCKYNEWYYTWKKDGHLKLDFDAREYTKSNLKIVQLFDEYFAEIKVVIHSHKGSIEAYFIHLDDYNKYDYWKQSYQEMKLPYIAHIDLTDIGTVEIIKTIIEIITKINNGCTMPGICGDNNDHTFCDTCMIRNHGIIPSVFNFKIKKIAFFHSIFPKTITITSMNENNIVIDCEKNFTEDEKNVIYKYKIHRLKDLVTHPIIHAIDKTQCLLYYNLVLENYNANGFEVFVNFASIQLDKYLFNIIVLHDQTIKYCSCSGETSFLIINQNYML
jgi:hypothetical protein